MELNKRKSLLTPASPTVWGMIHGDIEKQQDIVEMIDSIKTEVITEVNLILADAMGNTQPMLVTGKNIKSLKGRSILGAGDIDPLDDGDRALLQKVDTKADATSVYTKRQVDDLVSNIEVDTTNLATKSELQDLKDTVDNQIGAIDTMTDDILA